MQTLAENFKKDGFRITLIKSNQDIPHMLRNLKGLRTIFNFIFYIRALFGNIPRADVVYIFASSHLYFFLIVMPAVTFSSFCNKKSFVNYHGGAPQTFFSKFHPFVRYIMKQATITVPSDYLKEVIGEYLDLKAFIVPNIAHLNLFKYRERSPLKPYILCTRHFEHAYNIPCVIKAFRIIAERKPGAKLGLVGEGKEKKKIVQLVEDLGLMDKVQFYGCLPNNELPDIYDKYSIFINASKMDNFPLSILEAYASGLPVVSTNPGGIPYLVKDKETGLLVTKNDHLALAKQVIYLLDDPSLALRMAKKARLECEQYSWKMVRKILLELIG